MMKRDTVIPYLKKIQKIYFHQKSATFVISRNTNIDMHFNTEFLILLTLFESFKVVLMNMVAILMMSVKLATLVLLKIRVF